jgi:hypothetical protein
VTLDKREDSLHPLNTGTERSPRAGGDTAVENLARESHFPVGEVKQLYVDELAKLNGSAHVKIFLSIFALRHVRKLLRNRRVTKRAPARPDGSAETGHPVAWHRSP